MNLYLQKQILDPSKNKHLRISCIFKLSTVSLTHLEGKLHNTSILIIWSQNVEKNEENLVLDNIINLGAHQWYRNSTWNNWLTTTRNNSH